MCHMHGIIITRAHTHTFFTSLFVVEFNNRKCHSRNISVYVSARVDRGKVMGGGGGGGGGIL